MNDKTKKKWDLNLFKVKFNRVEEIDFKDEIAHDINQNQKDKVDVGKIKQDLVTIEQQYHKIRKECKSD